MIVACSVVADIVIADDFGTLVVFEDSVAVTAAGGVGVAVIVDDAVITGATVVVGPPVVIEAAVAVVGAPLRFGDTLVVEGVSLPWAAEVV